MAAASSARCAGSAGCAGCSLWLRRRSFNLIAPPPWPRRTPSWLPPSSRRSPKEDPLLDHVSGPPPPVLRTVFFSNNILNVIFIFIAKWFNFKTSKLFMFIQCKYHWAYTIVKRETSSCKYLKDKYFRGAYEAQSIHCTELPTKYADFSNDRKLVKPGELEGVNRSFGLTVVDKYSQ